MRARSKYTAIVAGLAVAGGIVTTSIAPAVANSGPVFTVMNTSETPPDGVWFRNSPHTADTDRVTGHGVYMNEQVQLTCFAWGDSVGQFNDTLWYDVDNVTRPTNNGVPNSGYLNAHYINDGKLANQIDSGVPECGATPTPTPTPTPASIGRQVTYYSGLGDAGAAKARTLDVDRVLTANNTYDGRWYADPPCTPSTDAVNFAGKDINRLAGWSLGRLGPIYALKYMKDHNQDQARRINYVILFDPGSPANFGSCDYDQTKVQASATLAWWLQLSSDNRLIVISGNPTATNHHQSIQQAYFPAIKAAGQAVRQRVLVCNYNLNHEQTYNNYAYLMTSTQRVATTQGLSSCPKQGNSQVWGWNP
jgi:hypothetical protein